MLFCLILISSCGSPSTQTAEELPDFYGGKIDFSNLGVMPNISERKLFTELVNKYTQEYATPDLQFQIYSTMKGIYSKKTEIQIEIWIKEELLKVEGYCLEKQFSPPVYSMNLSVTGDGIDYPTYATVPAGIRIDPYDIDASLPTIKIGADIIDPPPEEDQRCQWWYQVLPANSE